MQQLAQGAIENITWILLKILYFFPAEKIGKDLIKVPSGVDGPRFWNTL